MAPKRKRVTRFEGIIKAVGPRSWDELISLLTRIIGETVKDKVVRAILVGVLGAFGNYATSVSEQTDPPPPPPPEQTQVLQNDKTPE
jgi:hypothetical protein